MKKNLKLTAFSSLLLLVAAVTSCAIDNFDNPVNVDQDKRCITFNTGSLYEELGIQESMSGKVLPTGNYVITDSVLIYDQEGALVTKLGVESNTLEKKELELADLPLGTYTLILWQTAYKTTTGLKAWKVEGEESLSSVNIYTPYNCFAYVWAVGYAAATATLDDRSQTIEMTPKALGCIMDVTIENYTEDLGFIDVAMVGGREYKGVYLNPSRQEDRWISQEGYADVPFRIYPEAEGKGKFFTLGHGEDLTLGLRGDKEGGFDNLGECPHKTLVAGENYTFYLDIARRNWQPPFLGSAEDFTAWKADRDAGLLVIDPCINWGCNVGDVEAYVHQKQWWKDGSTNLVANSNGWTRYFWVANSFNEQYLFETEDGQGLKYVVCQNYDPAVPIEMANYLISQQGYVYSGKILFPGAKTAYDIYFSADNETEIFVAPLSNGLWLIAYQPTDPNDLQYIVNAVDLGLSVKWGTCNLGASKPEEFGDYYAWGEVEPYYSSLDPLIWKEGKENGYDWTSYRWCDGTEQGFTKYLHPKWSFYWAGEGEPDGKMILDPEDDAAHVKLGGTWRMPTYDDWIELMSKCTWEWSSENGVEGMRLTSNINGNSIFFPAAGAIGGTTPGYFQGYYMGDSGLYWSSSTDKSDPPSRARAMTMKADMFRSAVPQRYRGYSIRPVME